MLDLNTKQSPEKKEVNLAEISLQQNGKPPSPTTSTSHSPHSPRKSGQDSMPFISPRASIEYGYTSPRAPVGSMSKRISSPRRLDVRNLNEVFNGLEKLDRGIDSFVIFWLCIIISCV